MGKRRSRLVEEIETLRREVEQHREKLSTLELIREESRSNSGESDAYEGICAECSNGVLFRSSDYLHCTSCGYRGYL
ncbi:hypothetical protein ACFFQF_02615 [Haladaptatus pallidirubidus]